MDYEIKRYQNGHIVGIETTDGLPFEMIKTDAKTRVEIGVADRVEVRDMAGALVFHHPRVLRPANP